MSGIMKGRVSAVYPQKFQGNRWDGGRSPASLHRVFWPCELRCAKPGSGPEPRAVLKTGYCRPTDEYALFGCVPTSR